MNPFPKCNFLTFCNRVVYTVTKPNNFLRETALGMLSRIFT